MSTQSAELDNKTPWSPECLPNRTLDCITRALGASLYYSWFRLDAPNRLLWYSDVTIWWTLRAPTEFRVKFGFLLKRSVNHNTITPDDILSQPSMMWDHLLRYHFNDFIYACMYVWLNVFTFILLCVELSGGGILLLTLVWWRAN